MSVINFTSPIPVQRVVLAWSSGKDSAWALHCLRRDPAVEVVALLTTVTERDDRVAVHDVRTELVRAQAAAAGLPLWRVPLPWPCPNAVYAERLAAPLARSLDEGVTHWAFGDLFLEDIRAYREQLLAASGIAPLFPLWCEPDGTQALARQMIDGGLRAVITCLDPARVPRALAGRRYDRALIDALPAGIDPCGERGEFHTFCTYVPAFEHPLDVVTGATTERDGYCLTDVTLDADTIPDPLAR